MHGAGQQPARADRIGSAARKPRPVQASGVVIAAIAASTRSSRGHGNKSASDRACADDNRLYYFQFNSSQALPPRAGQRASPKKPFGKNKWLPEGAIAPLSSIKACRISGLSARCRQTCCIALNAVAATILQPLEA